ncbi:MAG: hypothetical protein AB9873_02595 [Syntrophobacteraceae bacterium]
MDAVTYPTAEVTTLISRELVALRLPHDRQPLADDWRVVRTPCLILLDGTGKEHHRSTGFLSAESLLAMITLGIAKIHYDAKSFEPAIVLLDRVINEHPSTEAVSEALYLRGRSLFRLRHDPAHLKTAYEQLSSAYPKNEWTRRAFKYRLL